MSTWNNIQAATFSLQKFVRKKVQKVFIDEFKQKYVMVETTDTLKLGSEDGIDNSKVVQIFVIPAEETRPENFDQVKLFYSASFTLFCVTILECH